MCEICFLFHVNLALIVSDRTSYILQNNYIVRVKYLLNEEHR